MKEFKGTRGPWGLVSNNGVSYGIIVESTSLGLNICDVNFSLRGDMFGVNARHDANLIAAAPDLLEALQEIIQGLEMTIRAGHDRIIELGGQCDDAESIIKSDYELKKAHAAIAKALGE